MDRRTMSQKSGLTFPVARIKTMLKAKNFASRISDTGAVFLTAVLEYLTAEILELSLNVANGQRIRPQHIETALIQDAEFLPLFRKAVFPGSTFVTRHTSQEENH
ncbi:hypothetical protein AVEN_100652-1 [Araneus ventricosus]|uniref:Histone H2A n=1 Tax=Araneus ventricosus TaxID=182803 RepID=A0A4Y2KP74_ARAVE|nr:hypothetical protein AVEN_100652-1 [Araneus ventricosus]